MSVSQSVAELKYTKPAAVSIVAGVDFQVAQGWISRFPFHKSFS